MMGKFLLVVVLYFGNRDGNGSTSIDLVLTDQNQCTVIGEAIVQRHKQKFTHLGNTVPNIIAQRSNYMCIEIPGVYEQ